MKTWQRLRALLRPVAAGHLLSAGPELAPLVPMAFVLQTAIFVAVDSLVTVPKWVIQRELHPWRNFSPKGLT